MTISEFRNFIQEGVLKLYAIHILEERKKQIEKLIKETAEVSEPSVSDEIYAEIETRMRPTDQFLSVSEISEIADIYDVDFEAVLNIMQSYINDRAKTQAEDLSFAAQETLKSLHDEGNQNPTFSEFLQKFNEFEHDYSYSTESIKSEFDKLTKDPNQLSLFEKMLEEALREDYGEQFGNPNCMDNPKVCMNKPEDIGKKIN